jgi:hypothetical protein
VLFIYGEIVKMLRGGKREYIKKTKERIVKIKKKGVQ